MAPVREGRRVVVDGGVVEAMSVEWVSLPIEALGGGRGGGVGIKRGTCEWGCEWRQQRWQLIHTLTKQKPRTCRSNVSPLAPVTADGGDDARNRHHRHGGQTPRPWAPPTTGPATGGTTVATVAASPTAWAAAVAAAAFPTGCRPGTAPSEEVCPQAAGRARRPARRRTGLSSTEVPADALRRQVR